MTRQEICKQNATVHGGFGTPLYRVWNAMWQRCTNSNVKEFRYYGGREIKVCEDWKSFPVFREWALSSGYEPCLTLDRIEQDGNYEPTNCRWITLKEQQRNKRNNVILTYNGESHCASEWAEILGINYKTIMSRIARNWSVDRILSTQDARRKEVTNRA